jgi:hypothetical protein
VKRSTPFCAILLFTLPAFATISQRQSPVSHWNSGASLTCSAALGSGYIPGDLIVVWTFWKTNSPPNNLTASVADLPYTNTYLTAVGPTLQSASNTYAQIFYAKNITNTGSGGDAVTVTYSGSADSSGCVFVEYQGADQNYPLDSVSAGYSTSGNPTGLLDSGNAAPANSNLLLFGGGTIDSGTAVHGIGFSDVQKNVGSITEQMLVSGNNTLQRATAGLSIAGSGNWVMQMAAFSRETA